MSRIEDLEQQLMSMGYANDDVQLFIDAYVDADDVERERLWSLGDGRIRGEMRTLRRDARKLMAVAPPASPAEQRRAVDDETSSVLHGATAREVFDWVGNNIERARVALDYENSFENPRRTVIARLGKLAEF